MIALVTLGLAGDIDMEVLPDPAGGTNINLRLTNGSDVEIRGRGVDRISAQLAFVSVEELKAFGQSVVELAEIEEARRHDAGNPAGNTDGQAAD